MEATTSPSYSYDYDNLKNGECFSDDDEDEESEEDNKKYAVIARKSVRFQLRVNGRPTRVRNAADEEIELIDLTSDKEDDPIVETNNNKNAQSTNGCFNVGSVRPCQFVLPLQPSVSKPVVSIGPWRDSTMTQSTVSSSDEMDTATKNANADSLVESMLLFDAESVVLESEPTFPFMAERMHRRKRRRVKRKRCRGQITPSSHLDQNPSESDSDAPPRIHFKKFKRKRQGGTDAPAPDSAQRLQESKPVSEEIQIFQPVIKLLKIDNILENGGTVKLFPSRTRPEYLNGTIKRLRLTKMNLGSKVKKLNSSQNFYQGKPVTATRSGRISKPRELHPGYVELEHIFDSDDSSDSESDSEHSSQFKD